MHVPDDAHPVPGTPGDDRIQEPEALVREGVGWGWRLLLRHQLGGEQRRTNGIRPHRRHGPEILLGHVVVVVSTPELGGIRRADQVLDRLFELPRPIERPDSPHVALG